MSVIQDNRNYEMQIPKAFDEAFDQVKNAAMKCGKLTQENRSLGLIQFKATSGISNAVKFAISVIANTENSSTLKMSVSCNDGAIGLNSVDRVYDKFIKALSGDATPAKGMTKCKTCGADIAKSAKRCPSCGAKLKKIKWWHILLGLIVFIIVVSILPHDDTNNSGSSAFPASTQNAASDAEKNESKAKDLLDSARSNFEDGNYQSAFSKCDKVLSDYPDTQVAATVTDFLNELYDSVENITATDLYKEYEANEVNADNKYKSKVIVITGIVSNIGKDILNNTYITLKNGSAYGITSIQCYFNDSQSDAVAKLKKGESIKLIGECGGESINISINDSYIIG